MMIVAVAVVMIMINSSTPPPQPPPPVLRREPCGEGAVTIMMIGMMNVEDTFHSTTDDDDWIDSRAKRDSGSMIHDK